MQAHLEGAHFHRVNLKGAKLMDAYVESTIFYKADLKGTNFATAIVNEETSFWESQVSARTDFRGVGLDRVRIEEETKELLKYNIRRMKWEDWYKEHPKMKWFVQPFWWMSDYGLSTGRIIVTFFAFAFIFANVYYHWGRIAPPGIVENLFVDRNGVDVQWWLVPLRTLYFSIVTQTTLGFGDMYARAQSIWGHILLSLQVILGYVLLGALVTRFAVLFTAGGPAGEFSEKEQDYKNK